MEQYKGKSVFPKVAVGTVFYYEKNQIVVKRDHVEDTKEELSRFEQAREKAQAQLRALGEKARREAGEAEAAVFDVYMMMLDDEAFCNSVYHSIHSEQMSAEYAVAVTGAHFSEMFADMEDEYMKARAADMKDIAERIVNILADRETDMPQMEEAVILVAEDLTPSEAAQMDKTKLLGFVTRYGSNNSHTAILARGMNIPALTGVDIDKAWHGKEAVIDGTEGMITINPDAETIEKAKAVMESETGKIELLKALKGKETITKDGKKLKLYANIGSVPDVCMALQNDAEGVGLFRSEFLYLESKDYPTEQEQFAVYKTVAEKMAGKKVVIRTLDIGADKQVDYFRLETEENPALGTRGIRICLTQPDVFKVQLRAILRASAFGSIAVMFPMIISLEEVQKAKTMVAEAKAELKEQGIAYSDIEIGVMIETPAAVMISGELAKEVDFLSIGTNDLTQYTLAVDRRNPKLDKFYNTHHPAVLQMIQMTVENGHKGGAWVGICGELGADTTLTETFLRMGIDELSVSPGAILSVREKVRQIDLSE